MEKDYLKIFLDGLVNPDANQYLDKYFKRQMKIAESEHFENDEFLSGCLRVVKIFEDEMDSRVFERKNELYMLISLAENTKGDDYGIKNQNGEIHYKDKQKHIDDLEHEASIINRDNFPVNLLHFTRGIYTGHLTNNELYRAKIAILLNQPEGQEDKYERVKQPEDSRDRLKKLYLGLTYKQIDKSYDYFNNFLFKDLTFDQYLNCFDLDVPIEIYPTFISGNTIKFITFLDGINTVTINDNIAKVRFGIKNYKQSKDQGLGNKKENIVFKSKIKTIYELNDIKIN